MPKSRFYKSNKNAIRGSIFNESPSEAVIREIYEESGFSTKVVKLLAVYDRSKHPHIPPFPYHVYKLFFHCEIISGSPTQSLETDGVDFFDEDSLPELSVSRTVNSQITRFFEHYRHKNLPTDFD
ncbi:MAG: NUDIX domain-containing protein [Cyanobacteriota bacterium]|nr:NUDIX domain-containing protein [Cyanobacteriota bacterium]